MVPSSGNKFHVIDILSAEGAQVFVAVSGLSSRVHPFIQSNSYDSKCNPADVNNGRYWAQKKFSTIFAS